MYIWDLHFGVGEIIWGLIFLVFHCPIHFLSIKLLFFRNWTVDRLGSLRKLVIFGGL